MNLYFLYGILTGLIPSLHPNNLVNFVNSDYLLEVAIVHSFISIIPNIYFLIPDVYSVSSLNASQKLFKEGKALLAVLISGIGSFLGGLYSLIFYYFPEIFYYLNKTKFLLPLIFLIVILNSILTKESFKLKIITFLLLLNSYLLIEINYEETKDLFLPLIGFFGLSSLFIFSLNKIEQEINLLKLLFHSSIDLRKVLFFSFLGVLLSTPANVYPLTTPTHFLLFLSLFFEIGLYYSIVLVSSMSTADFILSLITKEYFGYSRNYVVSFSNFSFDFFNLFFILLFSLILLILIGLMITILTNILPRKVILIIVFLSIIWPFFLDLNIWKIFTLLVSSFLGFLSLKFGIERINLFNGYLIWYLLNYYF